MVLAIGLSHKTAPVEIREQCAFAEQEIAEVLEDLRGSVGLKEVMILSTCNRTEIYSDAVPSQAIIDWWQSRTVGEALNNHLYQYQAAHAAKHLMRVAAGLDSLVIGEPQILGQLKDAYRDAQQAGMLGKKLGRLCQHSFRVAKLIRNSTGISSMPVSVAYAGVCLAKHIFADLKDTTALLVGAGDTVQLVARHLKQANVKKIWIANRTIERSQVLAQEIGGEPIHLSAVGDILPQADIIMSATRATLPIIGKGMVESALKRRRHRPLYMVDLAVPRDIEPEIGQLPDVYLYTVDDLEGIISQNAQMRLEAAKEAEVIVQDHAAQYMSWLHSQDALGMISSLRDQVEEMCQKEQAQALSALESGQDPKEVLARFSRGVTNKLLHYPTVRLRQAAINKEDEIVALFKALLDKE